VVVVAGVLLALLETLKTAAAVVEEMSYLGQLQLHLELLTM
jgi:hypothetical protein